MRLFGGYVDFMTMSVVKSRIFFSFSLSLSYISSSIENRSIVMMLSSRFLFSVSRDLVELNDVTVLTSQS